MREVFTEKAAERYQKMDLNTKVEEDIIDLGQYWRTIKRAKWLILTVTLSCMLLGGLGATRMTPIYKASASILADPQKPTANSDSQIISGALVVLFYQTQYEIINSRKLAETVIDKLRLVEKYKQSDEYKDRDVNAVPLSDKELRIKLAIGIQDNLEVKGLKQSQIINISYSSPDAEEAAAVVNAIAESYIQFGLETRLGEVKNTQSWLSEQSAKLKTTLLESEKRLSTYRSQQGLVNTEQQQNLVNNQLQSLNNELIMAQTRLSAAQEQYLAIKNVETDSKELYSLGPVLQNNTTRDMVKDQARLSQRVNELFERYGEKHPSMIAARSELKSATENLATEVNKVVQNIEKDYRLAQVQVLNIEKLIAKSRDNIQELQTENFSLVSLERDVENNRRIYENFQLSLLEASGTSDYNASNVHIVDSATVPLRPSIPNIKLILAMIAMIFGLIMGIGLAFLREAMDNTFKTPDAVENKLFIPVIGITPVVKKKKHAAVPEKQYLQDSLSTFAESINTIRTGLLFSNIDNPPKTMLITSADGSEGKSTLAINLAVAFSNIGKTLLLEVDLRKPSVAKFCAIPFSQGLTDLVMGSVSAEEDFVHQENNGKLSVITAGTIIRNPIELLSSKKFEEVLALFKEHYEYIVLDGPPTLPVSDSCILANKVDAVIVAVRAEETKVNVAKEAVSRLQKLHANVIGAVLTVADPKKMSYYGEHFQTGEYYGEKPNK